MVALSRKNIVIGLLAVGINGSAVYAGSQYALYSHVMNVSAHEHIGTVLIRGKIHGQPFQWINNVEVSTALPRIFIVLGKPYSYTLRFQWMKGNKAKLKFVVWQRRPLAVDHGGKGDKSQAMVWEAVVPSMVKKDEPVFSPMSAMHYLPNTPVSAADGKVSVKAGNRNELQAAWIGAQEALGDVH